MTSSIVKNIMTDYKYLFIIRCKIDKEFEPKYIPSFITNKTAGYLIKSIDDVFDIIKEIFLVWRYKYHSDSREHIRKANFEYMEQIIQKMHDLKFSPYYEFNIGSGREFTDIDCWFKVYSMRGEFIDLLDLMYDNNKLELINKKTYLHRVIPYVLYKDTNPNRLHIHITQNPQYITKSIDQTFLLTRKIHDLEFYIRHFSRLNLTIKNPQNFINLIKSGISFLMTEDDFTSSSELLYVYIYFLAAKNESVTTVQQNFYYLKMDSISKSCDELFYLKNIHPNIQHHIMSFL